MLNCGDIEENAGVLDQCYSNNNFVTTAVLGARNYVLGCVNLRTFTLIVYAHPYCARNSCRNAMLRHARARAQRKKSIHIKGWYPLC